MAATVFNETSVKGTGNHPNSIANLRPGTRNLIPGGKPSVKRKIRRFVESKASEPDAEFGEITYEEKMILMAMRESMNERIEPIDRDRARRFLFDRLHGKPVEHKKISGTVHHQHSGKRLSELTDAEFEELEPLLHEGKAELIDGVVMLKDAEFEDEQS